MFKLVIFTFFTLISGQVLSITEKGQTLSPVLSSLIQLDSYFTHHVLVVEKSTHKIYLYQSDYHSYKLIETFNVATGQKAGDKSFQGDFRTPEGIFFIDNFLPHKKLIETKGEQGQIYGVGAFTLNFPNPVDQIDQKTGGGIWIHSTNDETRIEKGLDSRGCVVTKNSHLINLSKYIELNKTPVIITHEVQYVSKEVHNNKKSELLNFLDSWKEAWRSENKKSYFSHYSKNYSTLNHSTFKKFKNYKSAVFNAPGAPNVEIGQVSLLSSKHYTTATFIQEYNSKSIKDFGKKTLYLIKDQYYNWKIIAEVWSKKGVAQFSKENNKTFAFRPSMRFFDPSNLTFLHEKNSEKQ